MSSPTIARWLKKVISDAGIDSSIFKAHSVRSACTSAASNFGVTTKRHFEGGWLEYFLFLSALLLQACSWCHLRQNSTCVSYEQHHWYVRLSLLKYNYRMAKAAKRLNAILDYMKKVKSSISMLPPTHSRQIDMPPSCRVGCSRSL